MILSKIPLTLMGDFNVEESTDLLLVQSSRPSSLSSRHNFFCKHLLLLPFVALHCLTFTSFFADLGHDFLGHCVISATLKRFRCGLA